MTQSSPGQADRAGGAQSRTTASRSIRERLSGGGWYFAVTIFTAGFLAAIPFWHAARRLERPSVRRLALIYTALGAFLVVLMALTPDPNPDGTSGNSAISTIGGMTVLAVVIAACVQLRSLRREVYRRAPVTPAATDPLVERALAARQRRAEARELYKKDPALARELGIGRPDLGRGYDDGGLVDVTTAPAGVISRVCGIDQAHADAIAAARRDRGQAYFNLGELFIEVDLPSAVQDQVREHAIL